MLLVESAVRLTCRAIYYNPNERYVGIAGKPGSVNALNVNNNGDRGRANGKLAGIRKRSCCRCGTS